MNGKVYDIIVEEFSYVDKQTGVRLVCDHSFYVWFDDGYNDLIKTVEGVIHAFNDPSHYHIYIDKRYDIEYIKKEVEAVLLCAEKGDKNAK